MDVAGSAVGIASLGIQICQGLLSYYDGWSAYKSDISNAYDAIKDLSNTLSLLKSSLERGELDEERSERVKECLTSCGSALAELSEKLQKLQKHKTPEGWQQRLVSEAQRAWYPLRAKTLVKLREIVDGIQERLKLAIQVLQLDISTTQTATIARISATQEQLLAVQKSGQFKVITDWLSAPDPATNHESARQRHQPQTGEWLLQCDQYKRWKTGTTRHISIYGIAGCGKTILCSTAIEDIRAHSQTETNTGLAFFYFSFTDSRKQTCQNLVRSLVTQLAWKEPGLSMLRQAYDRADRKVLGPDELERILYSSMTAYDHVFLVMDALDECPEDDEILQGVLKQIECLAQCAPNLKILATSRDQRDVRESMELLGAEQIVAATDVVDADILKYISSELQHDRRLGRLSAGSKAEVEKILAEKADGMFRWVYCQLQELKKLPSDRPSHIRKALHNLPATLDQTYERMLTAIGQDFREDALTLLRWIAYARSPPTLGELVHAAIIDPVADAVDLDDCGRPENTLDILSSLVTVTVTEPDGKLADETDYDPSDSDDTSDSDDLINTNSRVTASTRVRLAHFSVKEYLESSRILNGRAEDFHLQSAKEHHFLAQSCLSYILHYSDSSKKTSSRQDLETFPLLEYAAKSWSYHASLQEDRDASRQTQFLMSEGATRDWLLVHRPDGPWGEPFEDMPEKLTCEKVGLYYASYFGLEAAVQLLLEYGADIEAQGSLCGTALQAASAHGYDNIVQILLRHGADIEAQGDYYGTALIAASVEGYDKTVQLLLRHGADIEAQGDYYGTALIAASVEGYDKTVQLLLRHGADIEARGGYYGTALIAASARGCDKTVQTLLRHGADIEAQGGHYGTALIAASANGHDNIMQILLRYGVNIEAQGGYYGTALIAVSVEGYDKTVQLLLRHGANLEAQNEDNDQGTALIAASASGFVNIVQILLRHGADVHARGRDTDMTSLQAASLRGRDKVVRLLLDYEADVNASGSHGNAVQLASTGGCAKVVQILLENGADIHAQGPGTHGTALQAALAKGHDEAVQLLLRSRADMEAVGDYRRILPRTYSTHSYDEVVQLLLGHGANVSKDSDQV